MKILKIRGCNLASLAGAFELDLEGGAIGRAGLFAITGPTGSGKTTLLDALCLALFDNTPRLRGANRVHIGQAGAHERHKLTAQDPRSLLRYDSGSGYAEVEFQGQQGRRFRARWSVHRAGNRPSGAIQKQKMELEDLSSGERLGGRKKETLALIATHLGLSFEQFTRSALLAQGQFTSFLKADDKVRAELLERMTGTDLYARISMAAFARDKQAQAELGELDTARSALGLLSPIERAQLQGSLKVAQDRLGELRLLIKSAEKAQLWRSSLKDLSAALVQGQNDWRQAEQRWKEREPERQRLQLLEIHEPARRWVQDKERLQSEAQAKSVELEALRSQRGGLDAAEPELLLHQSQAMQAQEQAQALLKELSPALKESDRLAVALESLAEHQRSRQSARDELQSQAQLSADELKHHREQAQTLQGAIKQAQEHLSGAPQAAAVASIWPSVKRDFELWLKTQAALARCTKARAQQQDAASLLAQAQSEHALAKAALEQAEAQTQRARAALPKTQDLDTRVETTLEHKLRCDASWTQAQREWSELHRLQRQTLKESGLIETLRARRGELAALEPLIRDRLKHAQVTLERGRAKLALAPYRRELVQGEPCPLCGSPEHPAVGLDPMEALMLETLEEPVNEQRQALASVTQESAKNEAKSAHLRDNLRGRSVTIGALSQSLRILASDHQALCEQEPRCARPGGLDQQLKSLRAQLKAHTDRTRAAREELETCVAAETRALKATQVTQISLHASQTKLETARSQAARQSELESAQSEQRLALVETLRDVPGSWPEDLESAPKATLERWREQLPALKRAQETVSKSELGLQKLKEPIARHTERQEGLKKQLQDLTTELSAAARQEQLLRSELQGLKLGGHSRESLRASVDQSAQALEQTKEALRAHQRKLQELSTRTESLEQQLKDSRSKLKSAEQHLYAHLQAHPLSMEDLMALLRWPGEQIQDSRERLSALQTQWDQAQAMLREREQALKRHQGEQPAEVEAEVLIQAEAEQEQLQEQLAGKRQDLKRDADAQQTAKELSARVKELSAQAQIWRTLKHLIGSEKGDKFRRFAQGLTLETLLGHANEHLSELAPRFRLARVPGADLDLQIVDLTMAREVRSVASLSGGETFLVSLALALGLASLSSSQTPVQTLFIDEGFGSLDPKSLDMALATLDALQAGGRQVGIISHVRGIGESVGLQIRVQPDAPGRSRLLLP